MTSKSLAPTSSNAFKNLGKLVGGVFTGLGAVFLSTISPALNVVKSLLSAAWNAISSAAQSVWNTIRGFFTSWWGGIVSAFTSNVNTVKSVLSAAWNAVSSTAQAVWNALKSFFTSWWNAEVSMVTTIVNTIKGVLSAAWSAISSTAQAVWNTLKSFFTSWWNGEVSAFTTAVNTVKSVLSAAWNAISSTAQSVWNAIKSFFTGWWSGISSAFTSAVNGIKSVLSSAWDTMKNDVTTIWNAIHGVFTTIWSGLTTGFSNAVAGIKSVWNTLQAIIKAPVSFIVNTIYDKGIVPVVNAVGSLIGLHLNALSFAEGGKVTQGTGPTSDDVLVRVSKGETIVSAEHSQALAPILAAVGVPGYGAGGVPIPAGMNAAGIPGYAPGGTPAGSRGAALGAGNPTGGPGGVIGAIGHVLGAAGSAVINVVGNIGKALANLTGDALAAAASAILNPLVNATPGGGTPLGAGLKKIPVKMVAALVAALKGTGGATGSGADIANYAASFVGKIPYVWGGTSLGRAGADCSGFTGAVYKHYGINAPRSSEAQSGWVKGITSPQSGGLAFYHSPAGGADPGHVAIIQNASSVISQGGGMGPQIMGLHGMPLLSMGVPPGGFGSAGGGSGRVGNLIANASTIGAYLQAAGLNKIATAGIMGNMLQESGGVWNIGGGGLIQITGANPTSLADSLAQTIAYINANGGMGPINAAQNVAAATEIFMNQYERPAPATENLANRLAGANAAYAAGYAGGGIIPEPVLGYGLHSGRPYTFAEHGPETVIPGTTSTAGGGSKPVINFNYYGPSAPTPEQQHALFLKASAMIGVS